MKELITNPTLATVVVNVNGEETRVSMDNIIHKYDGEKYLGFYKYYGADMTADSVAEFKNVEYPKALKEINTKVTELIQKKVEDYNEAHKTDFGSVHSCKSYSTELGYTHQPFCQSVWSWNVSVWEYVRAELTKVEKGERDMPASDEAIAEVENNVPFTFSDGA